MRARKRLLKRRALYLLDYKQDVGVVVPVAR